MSAEDFSENKITEQLRKQQDLSYAIVGGATAAIVCAVLWAIITVSTKYQIGYMAIGVGLGVGLAVRFFGAGVDFVYQLVGAVLALVGCMLGNLLSQVGFMANAESLGYFETMTYLNYDLIVQIYSETFNPMDLLFYGIAIYEGYRFSIRPATDEIIQEFNSTGKISPMAHNNLRFPIVLGSFIAIGIFAYFLSKGTNGHRVFSYESGAKMSEGDYENGKENGEWSYWSEDGSLQSKGNFVKGVEEGVWEWYGAENKIVRKGSYKNGLPDGVWINYFDSGIVSDSGNFVHGRQEGPWIYRYENGIVSQSGEFRRDRLQGEWSYFYENGNLSVKGSYDDAVPTGLWKSWYPDGKQKEEIEWVANNNNRAFNQNRLINSWDESGKQQITNGNGFYKLTHENGKVLTSGEIKNGLRVGKWVSYFDDGNKQEEGEYKGDIYHLINSWSADGTPQVVKGSGNYTLYHNDKTTAQQIGQVSNGLRQGAWVDFNISGDTLQLATYIDGNLHGIHRSFYQNGYVQSEGNFQNNKREGDWNWYYESGILQSTAVYQNDKKEGVQVFWSESGKKSKEEHYKNGELISENLVTEED